MFLQSSDFSLTPLAETWTSPITSAKYPIRWRVEIPRLGLSLEVSTPLKSQELSGAGKFAPNYWEGAISAAGHRGAGEVRAVGYLEMTGYDRPVELGH
jgi:predicted secreted hydrolase